MFKTTTYCLGPIVAIVLMAQLAVGQPPVRQVPGQQPAQQQQPGQVVQQQPAQMQQQMQQQQAPQLRQIGEPNTQAPAQRMQRSMPAQVQGGGQPGQYRMMQQQPQMMIVPGSRWYLGVSEEAAPQGVRVATVNWNTPASSLGLETGDYIMDVMGYPVGFYQGWYYPLGQALDNYARPDGWVNMMIWNKRTGQQQDFWVRLYPR